MATFRAALFLLFALACRTTEPGPIPDKSLLQQPEGVYPYFLDAFRTRNYAKAYDVLSREIQEEMQYGEFYIQFASFDAMNRLILRSEAHAVLDDGAKGRIVRVCNPEYGFSDDVRIRLEKLGRHERWTLYFSRDQRAAWRERALEWWDFQYRAVGDFYVYPRDARRPRKSPECLCKEMP